jgi:hypothetical protein
MGGGLLQLVAYGAQDAYISGNPQITFFKGLYKRHTNFAMEPFRVNFSGQAAWGTKQSAVIGRHADLMFSTYLEVVLDSGNYNNDQGRLGYNLLKYVELEIGGQTIDRQYGEFLFLWDCLTSDLKQGEKLHTMVGGARNVGPQLMGGGNNCNPGNGRPSLPNQVLYVPFFFWYTRSPGAALPLIALQYHEVRINILWNDAQFISGDFTNLATAPQPIQAAIYVDYIYLDTEERRRMAQQSHEYLIEQTQFNEDKGISSYSNRIDLTFNHPVKELIWVVQPSAYTNCNLAKGNGSYSVANRTYLAGVNNLLPFTYDEPAVFEQWLQINGQDRLDKRYGDYFNKVQPYQHHSGSSNPVILGSGTVDTIGPQAQSGVYCYSFALKPEEHQPSGTCNFSRIDTATIVMNMSGGVTVDESGDDNWDCRVYAINYNILRVMSGMGGLAYSN